MMYSDLELLHNKIVGKCWVNITNNYYYDDALKLYKNLLLSSFLSDESTALKYLFYIRDINQGLGYRRLFRDLYIHLANQKPLIMAHLLCFIPKYGRWDDLIYVITHTNSPTSSIIRFYGYQIIIRQIYDDINNIKTGNIDKVSMIGKWLPTIKRHGKKDEEAIHLIDKLGFSQKDYRKILKYLRSNLCIVEHCITNKDYKSIDYANIPKNAYRRYTPLFLKKDRYRFIYEQSERPGYDEFKYFDKYELWHDIDKLEKHIMDNYKDISTDFCFNLLDAEIISEMRKSILSSVKS